MQGSLHTDCFILCIVYHNADDFPIYLTFVFDRLIAYQASSSQHYLQGLGSCIQPRPVAADAASTEPRPV